MSERDRERWDGRYLDQLDGPPPPAADPPGPPSAFVDHVSHFPTTGTALEIACGTGGAAIWMAKRGLTVLAIDVSPVAVGRARERAAVAGVSETCRFIAADLDDGLPPGPPVDVLLCHMFRDTRLDEAVVDRLVPGGLLAIAALSEVDAEPGRFRVPAGELLTAFTACEIIDHREADGRAALLARRPLPRRSR